MNFKRLSITLSSVAMILVVATSCINRNANANGFSDLYGEIDRAIEQSKTYEGEKDRRIQELKNLLNLSEDSRSRLRIYDGLISEYEAFICDSAFKYVEEARNLAENINDPHEQNRLIIKKADIASHAGLFREAHDMLNAIPRSQLDTALLIKLYTAYCNLYQYESEYMPDGEYTLRSSKLHTAYTDSLMAVGNPNEFSYLTNLPVPELKKGNAEKVKNIMEENLAKYEVGTRQYSILAATTAHMYKMMGNPEEEQRYLAMTVISDIKGAIKENTAIRELGTIVYEQGDVERANKYMKVSLDDAYFYGSRLRDAQSGKMLPVIDKAYDVQQKRLQSVQLSLIYVTSFLLLLAIVAIIVYMLQIRHVKEANQRANSSNEELSEMSERLRKVNHELERSNRELKNSNRTAQEYAGLFMEFCSLTISNLQKYHLALRNLALQGNVKGLLNKLDSRDVSNDTLRDFFSKFDEAILNIYPQFVEKVNSLLKPDEQIQLKNGEKLNTELRILALIKIGITDSEKISQFLRCSITTIYTYRSKLKKRAIDPDNFEKSLIFE